MNLSCFLESYSHFSFGALLNGKCLAMNQCLSTQIYLLLLLICPMNSWYPRPENYSKKWTCFLSLNSILYFATEGPTPPSLERIPFFSLITVLGLDSYLSLISCCSPLMNLVLGLFSFKVIIKRMLLSSSSMRPPPIMAIFPYTIHNFIIFWRMMDKKNQSRLFEH